MGSAKRRGTVLPGVLSRFLSLFNIPQRNLPPSGNYLEQPLLRGGFEEEQSQVPAARHAKQALKVLVIVSCFPPSKGGVEKTSYALAMGLAEEGNEVTVVTTSRGREPSRYEETMGPLRVIRYPETRFVFDAPIVPQIAMAALTEDYDVLHVHGMTPSITDLAIMFAKYRGKPVVLTYHNDAQETFPSPLARLAARVYSTLAIPIVGMADVIVTSTYSYAATSPVLKHILGRVTVVPWGTDCSHFEQKQAVEREGSEKHVLFVGQLKKYKGVHVLLESVARLKAAGYPVVADIVGTGPLGESLKSDAARLNLDGSARFWGAIDENLLPLFYLGSDVVALPSLDRREAFGLVMLEAFAAGKPVVATNIPGVSEAASRGVSYLAEPNDPASLADCIKRALEGAKNGPVAQRHEDLSQRKTLVKYESILRFASEGAKTWTFFLLIICTLAALQATGSLDSQNISAALTTLPNS